MKWCMAHLSIAVEGFEYMGPLHLATPVPFHVRQQAVELVEEDKLPGLVELAVTAANGALPIPFPHWQVTHREFLTELDWSEYSREDLSQLETYYNGYFTPDALEGKSGPLMSMEDAVSALVTHYRNVTDLAGSRPVALMVPTYILEAIKVEHEKSTAEPRG